MVVGAADHGVEVVVLIGFETSKSVLEIKNEGFSDIVETAFFTETAEGIDDLGVFKKSEAIPELSESLYEFFVFLIGDLGIKTLGLVEDGFFYADAGTKSGRLFEGSQGFSGQIPHKTDGAILGVL